MMPAPHRYAAVKQVCLVIGFVDRLEKGKVETSGFGCSIVAPHAKKTLGPLSPVSMGNLPCLAAFESLLHHHRRRLFIAANLRHCHTVVHELCVRIRSLERSDVSGLSVSRKQTQPSSRRGKSVIAVLPATATLNNHLPSFSDIDFDINTTTTTTHTAHCHSYIAGPTAHTILEGSLIGRADGGNPSQAGHCW